jgi:hypothetical protein
MRAQRASDTICAEEERDDRLAISMALHVLLWRDRVAGCGRTRELGGDMGDKRDERW